VWRARDADEVADRWPEVAMQGPRGKSGTSKSTSTVDEFRERRLIGRPTVELGEQLLGASIPVEDLYVVLAGQLDTGTRSQL
jgi:hypothetical protein